MLLNLVLLLPLCVRTRMDDCDNTRSCYHYPKPVCMYNTGREGLQIINHLFSRVFHKSSSFDLSFILKV